MFQLPHTTDCAVPRMDHCLLSPLLFKDALFVSLLSIAALLIYCNVFCNLVLWGRRKLTGKEKKKDASARSVEQISCGLSVSRRCFLIRLVSSLQALGTSCWHESLWVVPGEDTERGCVVTCHAAGSVYGEETIKSIINWESVSMWKSRRKELFLSSNLIFRGRVTTAPRSFKEPPCLAIHK